MATNDIDAFLSREASSLNKDREIERILKCFHLDSYAILDLLPGAAPGDIKAQYRKKSLLIHPDKTQNKNAPEAFNKLKKAEAELMDEKKRGMLDDSIADARKVVLRERGWSVNHPEVTSEDFLQAWREKTKQVLLETATRRERLAKLQMQQEGRERERQESEIEERKRKREMDKKWEETRDDRINNWRDFKKTATSSTKKKKKMTVLG
ncbi:hypothetical protein V1512DRAFT_139971 [Lipomyces arxii]|uniref:uncharacterized protein n=1 Tax=Lipomyces arxii TaxID=56418 RepID=UPI0034CFD690